MKWFDACIIALQKLKSPKQYQWREFVLNLSINQASSSKKMEPRIGFEPTTHALRMRCSTN